MAALITDYLIIGRSGKTIDGREIPDKAIIDMAETYDREVYTAVIWPNHGRYENYGIVDNGLKSVKQNDGTYALQARIAPNQFLLSDNKYGQNLFFSMEVMEDFAGTGKYYLTGLAVTDQPASLGTSQLSLFSKQSGAVMSECFQSDIKLIKPKTSFFSFSKGNDDMDKATSEAILLSLKAIGDGFAALSAKLDGKAEAPAPAPVSTNLSKEDLKPLTDGMSQVVMHFTKVGEQSEADAAKFSANEEKVAALEAKLEAALKEAGEFNTKPPSPGGSGQDDQKAFM